MVVCPSCGWSGKKFLPYKRQFRDNAECPGCGSRERHRYLYIYLKSILPSDKKIKVLHIGPFEAIRKLFLSYPNIEYLSIDIFPEKLKAMKKEDLTCLTFDNNQFDFIFACHVLEHVLDEKKALSEIYRVLKPGGKAILQVPIFDHDVTVEYEDEKERIKYLGRSDHVRAYGRDYKKD